jgi:hypothetical protein
MTRGARTSDLMWSRLFKRFDGGARTLQGQLRDMLVHAVMEGFISPGQPLPSSRLLADTLGLSRTTVTLALQALVDKGLIVARARSGLFVSEQLGPTYLGARLRAETVAEPSRVRWADRLKLRPSAQRNIEKPSDWQQQPYPFIYGQFDASLFPSADWRECVLESLQGRALRRWAPDHIDRDDDSLVEQIHRRLLPARGIWAERDEILVTNGAQQATFLLSTLLLGPSTVVGIENPGYPDARNNFLLRTRHVRALAGGRAGPGAGRRADGMPLRRLRDAQPPVPHHGDDAAAKAARPAGPGQPRRLRRHRRRPRKRAQLLGAADAGPEEPGQPGPGDLHRQPVQDPGPRPAAGLRGGAGRADPRAARACAGW